MNITKSEIRRMVSPRVYERGVGYYRFGRVQFLDVEPDYFKAVVSGTHDYVVDASQEPDGWIYAECTCPYWDDCKHIVAALLAAKDYYYHRSHDVQKQDGISPWRHYLEHVNRKQPQHLAAQPKWQLVYTLQIRPTDFIIHPWKATIKQDGSLGRLSSLGETSTSDRQLRSTRNDTLALSLLETSQKERSYYYYAYQKPAFSSFNYGDKIGTFFELIRDSQLFVNQHNSLGTPITFVEEKVGIEFRLSEEGERAKLYPYLQFRAGERILDSDYRVLCSDPIWVLHGNRLFQIEGMNQAAYLIPFTKEQYEVGIPKGEVPEFISAIAEQTDLFESFRLPPKARIKTIRKISEKRLYLDEFDEGVKIKLRFCYEDVVIDLRDTRQNVWASTENEHLFYKVIRDKTAEEEALQRLLDTSIKLTRDGVLCTRKNKTLNWLLEEVPDLIASGFVIFGEENLRRFKVNRSNAQIRVAVQSGIDWFDLQVEIDFGGILLSLKELRKALKQKSRYLKLADGSTASLPEEWLNRFRHVVNLSEAEEERLKLSTFHVTLIDELFAEAGHKDFDEAYREKLQRLKSFAGIKEVTRPNSLNGTLRPYQQTGLNWLGFLHEFSFGGCLADDMGLGKTIQALALLLSTKQNGSSGPTLVVTPTSVVFNWLNEMERFAPGLRALNLTGNDRPRAEDSYVDYDVIVTTYGILRRDIAFLKGVQFDYVILDESQYIKNPVSQTAKAAKLLKAKHRLALTGTPVENNILELWSLFSFLNPGLLGNLNYFKGAFATPIEKNGDRETAELLRKTVFPFVLRRTKDEVGKDLPPKVETIIRCEMSAQHEKLYNQWRDYYRAALLKQIAEVGMDKSRMNVLEGLTKLRQIACHPILVEKTFPGKVSKYDTLIEYFDELLSEGHKVLVFSQFVRMLTLVRKYLDSARIPYEYLDGKTRDRKSRVERFQNDADCKLFLISLRAGGTGLNLTAADYVIHYDPWWNPAVEAQATDRSHRIGQDKHVFVYKMISRGTVEEKILQLQERKKELVSNIISADSGLFKHLTSEDIEILFS